MFSKKNLAKLLLLALVLVVVMSVFSGCVGDTGRIDQDTTLDSYKDSEGNLPTITKEYDGSFIDNILKYIGKFIELITKITWGSYILALFIFAIVIEIIMLPFSIIQQKNSRKQAMMRPKEMAIRKKYAGRTDQATQKKVQEEIQELYQKENFNPMSGCLPLLVQLPVIMALYSIVVNPMKYVLGWGGNFVNIIYAYMSDYGGVQRNQSGTIGFISDFKEFIAANGGYKEAFANIGEHVANGEEAMEYIGELAGLVENVNFNIGPINTGYVLGQFFTTPPENKWLWFLLLIPVVTFVVYFFSSKLTRKFSYQPTQSDTPDAQTGCSNKMMDWMMPLMSVWMTFIVPGAVGIYWIFKSIIGVLKQFIMSKVMPMPKFTEEDYKAAEREYAGKAPKKVEKSANAGKVRSLHHIDDEDYDEKGNYTPKNIEEPAPEVEEATEEAPKEIPQNKLTDGASLKDESDRHTKKDKKDKKKK